MVDSISRSGALASGGALPFAIGRRKAILIAVAILALFAASITMVALSDRNGGPAIQKARDFFGLAKGQSIAEGAAEALVKKGQDFLALIKARSPGERNAANLIKSKRARVAAFVPRQRALAKIRKPAPPKEFLEALAPPVQPQLAAVLPSSIAPVIPTEMIPPTPGPGGPVIFPPGGPTIFPPGGGTPPPGIPPPPPPPEVPAVPEPSTWASMLLGFGLMGLVCRYRRRRRATAQA